MDEFEVFVELISEFLGEPKKVYESKGQLSFDCIECDDDKHKGNLEISLEKEAYHCWSCGISGGLGKLFDKYANKKQKKAFGLLKPDSVKKVRREKKKLQLPEGYVQFKESNPIYPPHREALTYLRNRGITDEIIEKYQIGYTMTGDRAGRIIIPSFNLNGELNYYIARSWNPRAKMKYMNPEAEKEKIIFDEHLIDWDNDIYLVEGVFDAFFVKNSIPLLGKFLSELLFNKIYENAKGNIIICLDGDAWNDAVKLYRELNGGTLHGRIKIIKLPVDKDVCDLKGNINEYYYNIK
jgi:DNA primase